MFFRYDYNYKVFIVSNLPTVLFLIIAIASFGKNNFLFCLSVITVLYCAVVTFVFIRNQGIRIKKGKIIIVDYLYLTTINLSEIKRVEIKEIEKERRSNIYGFLHEFFHHETYMWNCDYTYNNGKVYEIFFYLNDNRTIDSYFGWMYKEKSIKKVNKVQAELTAFVDHINKLCKEQRQRKSR